VIFIKKIGEIWQQLKSPKKKLIFHPLGKKNKKKKSAFVKILEPPPLAHPSTPPKKKEKQTGADSL